MLRVPAVVIGPCLAGIHHRIITAEVVGLGPRAFPGHDEDQVAEQAAELREAVTRHPQVDVACLGIELGDVAAGVQEGVIPHVRVLAPLVLSKYAAVSPKRRNSRRGW